MPGEGNSKEWGIGGKLFVRREIAVDSEDENTVFTEEEQERVRKKRDFSSRQTAVFDDGTNTFFWRAHSVTVLAIMIICFLFVSLIEDQKDDTAFNTKRGLSACVLAFCLFGMTQAKDGPMVRPHPAFWKLCLMFSIVYELALVFILFQTADDSRKLMSFLDPELGKPLPEQSYAEDCRFYDPDPNHPGGHFHNFWEKWDVFVFGHLVGWYFKMLMIRDYWLCWVISIMFEVLEYSLEHRLPNFAECWWDHWLMDVLICNGLGIWFAMLTLNYLNIKTYSWRGLWHISTYSGKLKRIVLQFTPYSWTKFEWRPTENLRRWCGVLGIISLFLLAELGTFYLKTILWIPPPHPLNWVRLMIYVPTGAVALRETYQFMEDPNCKKFGQQSWVISAMIITEFLIVLKFDFQLVVHPLPPHVAIGWGIGLTLLFLYTIWRFCLHFFIGKRRRKPPKGAPKVAAAAPSSHQVKSELEQRDRYSKGYHNGDGQNKGSDNGTAKSESPYRTRYRARTANGT